MMFSMPSCRKQNAEKLKQATEAAKFLTRGYTTTTITTEYLVSLADTLSWLTEQELNWVLDPREGVVTRCRFPPTAAEVHECIRDIRARFEAVRATRSTQYRYFDASEPDPRPRSLEYRKAAVIRQLGYDPAKVSGSHKREHAFKTIPITQFRSSDDLKTPSKPASPELLEYLSETVYPMSMKPA